MRILLLNLINRSYVIMPSLGLGYLASLARDAGHSVTVLNCLKERMSFPGFERFLSDHDVDLIGLQLYSYDLIAARRFLTIIRRISPSAVTVAGGPHPSGDPAGTMEYLPDLDYAFQGEAEPGFPQFLKAIVSTDRDLSLIPGLVYRSGDSVKMNPPTVVADLDSLPLPAWDLLLPESYPEAPHGAFTRAFPTAPVITSRGCPCKCTFCAGHRISGTKIRRRSIDNVMTELRLLQARGIREFHIEDENFTYNREYAFAFCERLLSERLGMSWSLPSGIRLDTIDRSLLLAMAKAGCYSLAVGLEFGSDRLLKETRKGLSLTTIRERMRLVSDTGIKVTGFFFFGVPGETREEMVQTIQLALELPLDRAQFNNFIPLPGSELWGRLKADGELRDVQWDRFFVHDVAFASPGITPAEIKLLQRKAYLRFYLRPRIILGLLAEIRSWRHLVFLLRRFLDSLT